jgi:hypothetical protein
MKKLFAVAMLFATSLAFGQPKNTNITEFIRQIQKWEKEGEKMKMAWWLPTDYWRIALQGNPDIPPAVVDQLENIFDEYVLISVANLTISTNATNATMLGVDEETILKTLSIIDKNGKKHYPLKRDEVSSEALQVEASMRPMFAQSLGEMGKSMHMFFFKIKDADQKNLIVASKEGEFTIQHSGVDFKWTLPLPILMPDQKCPTDKAVMAGDWVYCPYHGVKLK